MQENLLVALVRHLQGKGAVTHRREDQQLGEILSRLLNKILSRFLSKLLTRPHSRLLGETLNELLSDLLNALKQS